MTDSGNTGFRSVVDEAKSIYLLLPQYNTAEQVYSALGLYYALKMAQKHVFIACPTPLSDELKKFELTEVIAEEIGNRNLVVSLQLNSVDDIDKVSYHVNEEEKTFNLVVQPKADIDPIKPDNVNYSYSGTQADLVILIGATGFADFGHFYDQERKLFTESNTINISLQPISQFTTKQYVAEKQMLFPELIEQFLRNVGMENLGSDSATSLIAAIENVTNNLQNAATNPEIFELLAKLMRQGGIRGAGNKIDREYSTGSQLGSPLPTTAPITPPPVPDQPITSSQPIPKDWLQPKVFKGGQNNTSKS